MSIERSQSTSSTGSIHRPDAETQTGKSREPASPEKVDRFRTLMQQREGANQQPPGDLQGAQDKSATPGLPREPGNASQEQAVAAVTERSAQRGNGFRFSQQEDLPPAEVAALWQAQMTLRDTTPAQTAPTPPVNPAVFAEMIERHVRQMAVTAGGTGHGEGQVLLRLADATLPGTDLLLTRTADGWLLRADVRSRGSYDAIAQAAPELAERFAARNLGTLSIDPHFHG